MEIPVEYEQTDKRWANVPYTITGDRSQTIGTSGCGPTCAAMVIAALRDAKMTPVEACSYAIARKYRTKNSGTSWAFFLAILGAYKIPVRQTGSAEIAVSALKENKMVICCASKGIWTSSGHFVLGYGIENGKVLIHDPNSEKTYREYAELGIFKQQMIQFWIIEEEMMNEEKVRAIVKEILDGKGTKASASLDDEWDEAKARKITDGTNPKGYATREQVAAMIVRALED